MLFILLGAIVVRSEIVRLPHLLGDSNRKRGGELTGRINAASACAMQVVWTIGHFRMRQRK